MAAYSHKEVQALVEAQKKQLEKNRAAAEKILRAALATLPTESTASHPLKTVHVT
jgi:hypothetical protein